MRAPVDNDFQSKLIRLQRELRQGLRGVASARKALAFGLRKTRETFGAPEAALAVVGAKSNGVDRIHTVPSGAEWDDGFLAGYLSGSRPKIPANTLLAPVKRRGRNWAVVALRTDGGRFTVAHREALFSVAQLLTDAIQVVDQKRTRHVRRRLEQKIADQQEPRDLMYDILHGLRSLTHYNHSASLLISRDGIEPLEFVAEQIAWTKAKSTRIGLRLPLSEELREQLTNEGVGVYNRLGSTWRSRRGRRSPDLPGLLEYRPSGRSSVPLEVGMVCAPISTPDGTLGVLKLSSRRARVLDEYEARLVEDFMPLASLAIQFSVRTESLRAKMLHSERKHALANLTRGIAHDVNNALGATLPLVQQLRDDAAGGRIRTAALRQDLGHIESSIQTCRRIFGGMLAVARGPERTVGHGNLRRAIDGALSVLADSMRRRSIEVSVDLPEELPAIRSGQGDLTQVVLNLCANAKDAMPTGGRLSLTAVDNDESILLEIRDSGSGITAESMERVWEPFYTTKSDGNGLGLVICRSILWEIGGEMKIESEEGAGTLILITLPVLRVGVEEAVE